MTTYVKTTGSVQQLNDMSDRCLARLNGKLVLESLHDKLDQNFPGQLDIPFQGQQDQLQCFFLHRRAEKLTALVSNCCPQTVAQRVLVLKFDQQLVETSLAD